MSFIVFNSDEGTLRVEVKFRPGDLRCGASRNGVLHLHFPKLIASICGRVRVADMGIRDEKRAGSPHFRMCPYCLAALQREEIRRR